MEYLIYNMKSAMLLIFIIILFWGIWGFLNKLAVGKIGLQISFWNIVSFSIVTIVYLTVTHQLLPLKKDSSGISLAIAAGAVSGLASMLFYILLDKKPAGLLVTITALYPLITILLSIIFLKETVNVTKIIGFVLALLALVFLNL